MMSAGESAATMMVFELPPSADCRICVSFESRYGTKTFLPGLFDWSASALITLPRDESDLLIAAPSLRRSPVAPVDSARSEPARSTRFMSDRSSLTRPSSVMICLMEMVMMVCARDEVAFIWVAATVRDAVPASIVSLICLKVPTALAFVPSTKVPLGVVRTFRSLFVLGSGLSRSRIFSL